MEIEEIIESFIMNDNFNWNTKICKGPCGLEKNIDEFSANRNSCHDCEALRRKLYGETYEGFLHDRLKYSKNSAKKRKLEHNINYEFLIEQVKIQKGKCFLTGIDLVFSPRSAHQASLERSDPKKGYIKGNVVFIILEMQNPLTWTEEKLRNMIDIKNKNIQSNIIIEEPIKHQKREISIINNEGKKFCTHCKIFLDLSLFEKNWNKKEKMDSKFIVNPQTNRKLKIGSESYNKLMKENNQLNLDQEQTKIDVDDLKSYCRKCHYNLKETYKNTVRGYIKYLLASKDHERYETDIDYNFVINLYHKQKGLCGYSNMPMTFGSKKDWALSIERIDSMKGYNKENVILICREFNGLDHTRHFKYDNDGTGGWNRDKFNFIYDRIKIKYENNDKLINKAHP